MGTTELRRLIERRQVAYLWSQPHTITPRLVEHAIGDGKKLIGLAPTLYRPNHFVARIDSRHSLEWRDENGPDVWLDELKAAIEDEYDEWPWVDCYWPEKRKGSEERRVDFSEGSAWWEEDWPKAKKESAK